MNELDYQRTVALNNQGVAVFAEGERATALSLFRLALQTTIGGLGETTTQEEPAQSPPQEEQQQMVGSTEAPPPQDTSSLGSGPVNQHEVVVVQPQPQPYMDESMSSQQHAFTRAINLLPSTSAYNQDPLVNLAVASAIILFNLAVVYHAQGLENQVCESQFLSKARSLYNKSHSLLLNAGLNQSESSGHAVIDVVAMAIYNNLGQITHTQMDYIESQQYFGQLVVYAATVRPLAHDVETANLLDWHRSFFLSNAIVLQPPQVASAA